LQPRYECNHLVRVKGDRAEFIWSSTPDNPSGGSVDLRVRAEPSELIWLAKNMNCEFDERRILIPSLDAYNRMLLYSAVRSTLRRASDAGDLALLVLALNGYDAHYWASAVRAAWWKYERLRPIRRVARAFKLFFGLG
jgi:hypothetical protein